MAELAEKPRARIDPSGKGDTVSEYGSRSEA